jgi:acetyl-CoA acetyltransferase
MVDVAIVGTGQTPMRRRAPDSEMHMVFDVTQAAMKEAGVARADIGFTVSGSCDILAGQSFAFVGALEGVGAWPPISESHVEMDGAWALYEGWTKLQEGEVDVVLVYCHGRMSAGRPWEFMTLQLDPYTLTPLGLDPGALAALQARQLIDRGIATERDFAEVVARDRANAARNPNAQVSGTFDVEELLQEPYVREPLRRHDYCPISDGAAAVVLAAGDKATQLSDRPAWITGIDHRVDIHQPGMRDLTESPSAAIAAKEAGVADRPIEVAEITASFSPQDVVLRRAIGLGDDVEMNPSGGALGANPLMVAGLVRIIEAANQVRSNGKHRALAHATGGQALQQNLVAVLEDTRS